jgi:cobalt-zinc-cadmium efflux system outer membrane protein
MLRLFVMCFVRCSRSASCALAIALCAVGTPTVSQAEMSGARAPASDSITPSITARAVSLDSLIRLARTISPEIRAARAREVAAHLRIAPAGARPDPTLMAGVQNLPLASPSFRSEEMTMKMIGIAQSFPASGKLARRTRAARAEADAAQAEITMAALDVEREVKDAYYDVVEATDLLAITSRGQSLLTRLLPAAEAQYVSGSGVQADLVKARLEATRLAVDGAQLAEDRRSAIARLRAALFVDADGRAGPRRNSDPYSPTMLSPSDGAIDGEFSWPNRVLRAALGDTTAMPRFTAATLDARVTDSPVPSVDSMFAMAVRANAGLRAHEAMIGAAAARAENAARATRPDIDVALQYGQREGRSDMITATVSIPLPLQHHGNQDAEAAATRADVDALEAEHGAQLAALRRDIARLASALERDRTQLAIYRAALIPQARAGVSSLTTSYGAGRASLSSVTDGQMTSLTYESQFVHTLADFAKSLAELEQLIGVEVVQ